MASEIQAIALTALVPIQVKGLRYEVMVMREQAGELILCFI